MVGVIVANLYGCVENKTYFITCQVKEGQVF